MEQRYAASAIIYNENGEVLFGRRAAHKHPFPGVLSLCSTYIRDGDGNRVHKKVSNDVEKEQLREAVRERFTIEVVLDGPIGMMEGPQANYNLHMNDYIAKISKDKKVMPNGEDYSEAVWINPLDEFRNKNRQKMGHCTQVLLSKLDENPDFLKEFGKV